VRKIVVLSFITLDGVMQAPGGPEEDSTDLFQYGGWSVSYWDEVLEKKWETNIKGNVAIKMTVNSKESIVNGEKVKMIV
jgi:hypothetical protein